MTTEKQAQLHTILTVAYQNYSQKLKKHAFFKVNNLELSEDLVQATFLKTWRYLTKQGTIGIIKAFLYHVLDDLIIDHYRKHKTTSLEVLRAKGFEPSVDDSDHLFNFLDGRAAMRLIQLLPEKYKKVINLKYIRSLSLKEISLITGQSQNNTAVQAHRGIAKLKLLFNPA